LKRGSGSFTLANSVTLFRLLLVPLFAYLLVEADQRWTALAVFALMALGDAADGMIARMRREESMLGAVLDPAADKLLLLCAYLILRSSYSAHGYSVPDWLTLLVIGRDAYIVVGAVSITLLTGKLRVAPSFVGKASTFVQMATVALVLSGLLGKETLQVAYVATGMLTLASGIDYTLLGAAQLRKEPLGTAREARKA
jgi:cardiolipin synthase